MFKILKEKFILKYKKTDRMKGRDTHMKNELNSDSFIHNIIFNDVNLSIHCVFLIYLLNLFSILRIFKYL